MTCLLDLPSEILQLILHYAVLENFDATISGRHLPPEGSGHSFRNAALPYKPVSKRLNEEASSVPAIILYLKNRCLDFGESFIAGFDMRHRKFISRIVLLGVFYEWSEHVGSPGQAELACLERYMTRSSARLRQVLSTIWEDMEETDCTLDFDDMAKCCTVRGECKVSGFKPPAQ